MFFFPGNLLFTSNFPTLKKCHARRHHPSSCWLLDLEVNESWFLGEKFQPDSRHWFLRDPNGRTKRQSKSSKNQQRTGCVFKGMLVALSYLVKDLGYDRIETTIFIHRAENLFFQLYSGVPGGCFREQICRVGGGISESPNPFRWGSSLKLQGWPLPSFQKFGL